MTNKATKAAAFDVEDNETGSVDPSAHRSGLRLLQWFADFYMRPFTPTAVLSRLPAGADLDNSEDMEMALATLGFRTRLHRTKLRHLDPVVLPCIAFDNRNNPLIINEIDTRKQKVTTQEPGSETSETQTLRILERRLKPDLLLVTPIEDENANRRMTYTDGPGGPDSAWFWGPVRRNWRGWLQIMIATLLINLMGLALPLFVMNVYDRVIPTFSTITLWTLAIGVCIAIGLDLLLRQIRTSLLEQISRRVDLQIASDLFRQVMNIRLTAREIGAAGLASLVREYESIRELFASSSFVAAVDFLFVGVFIAALFLIVGPLAYVPLLAIFVTLTVAVLAQIPLARAAKSSIEVESRRMSLLSEALSGVTSVKSLNAENIMQRYWEEAVAASARLRSYSRIWANFTQSTTIATQQLTSVGIILWGVYLVVDGKITIGGLIAANILSSRALTPLATIAQTIFRAQYARKSLHALNNLMATPVERTAVVRSNLRVRKGAVVLKDITFSYPNSSRTALERISLDISPGERVAVLGRVGSGKSTLGMMLAGLIVPDNGTLLIDNHNLSQFDPAELREGIGYLPQTCEFFTGTLGDNLLIGRPNSSQSEIERALYLSGLDEFVAATPEGLELFIGDRGMRLSGGQMQALALARLLLRKPRLLFLDEPTNAMDQEMEMRVCRRLGKDLDRETGLILCTHRQPLAAIAERYIVLDGGRKVLDGPREQVMASLRGGATPEQRAGT
ncbi:type I secretion system permease/ATPase [Ruegeria marina]|uniref:ATP-binding cassette, subfamily C, LapB n=1 Tax=Ruegeria marina TaxID=639004 RepID=A0A1G7F975_9RHOB|nr:type I secretion system permease/ATPase [Ruegeria marina]SDE72442.1 ATP-binding cassette, subfamily C, LapB [Ruegeria marina]